MIVSQEVFGQNPLSISSLQHSGPKLSSKSVSCRVHIGRSKTFSGSSYHAEDDGFFSVFTVIPGGAGSTLSMLLASTSSSARVPHTLLWRNNADRR